MMTIKLQTEKKINSYKTAKKQLDALLENETDTILKMATINAVLKQQLPYIYWVGFYIADIHKQSLSVGPYQGTIACMHITYGKGVCGSVALSQKTKIVKDVTILAEGEDHITCDPNSKSEIVVPVFNKQQQLIAVLDLDSEEFDAFDEIDQKFLEGILSVFQH
ncbi:GAF domain-containing protein [Aquimarina agarilytica]|uniref:GAF domain-containing protein n=1 Tax=Aquimarina agarilytica TaxID=1087449 RepID=UPI00058DB71D|nr:GAF domain-containing protein [Aquimarina agarilytica]